MGDYRNRGDIHRNMRGNVELAVEYTRMLMAKIPDKIVNEEVIDWTYRPEDWAEKHPPTGKSSTIQ